MLNREAEHSDFCLLKFNLGWEFLERGRVAWVLGIEP